MQETFLKKYKLKGFALGMFVSELSEANYMSLPLDEELIDNHIADYNSSEIKCFD